MENTEKREKMENKTTEVTISLDQYYALLNLAEAAENFVMDNDTRMPDFAAAVQNWLEFNDGSEDYDDDYDDDKCNDVCCKTCNCEANEFDENTLINKFESAFNDMQDRVDNLIQKMKTVEMNVRALNYIESLQESIPSKANDFFSKDFAKQTLWKKNIK